MRSVPNRLADNSPRLGWLTTFNDMVTLLMVFFVLLFAMGTIDVSKVKHFQSAMQSALGVLQEGQQTSVSIVEDDRVTGPGTDQDAGRQVQGGADERDHVAATQGRTPTPSELIKSMVVALDNQHGIDAVYTPQGLLITLEDHLLFELGKADINQQGFPVLAHVSAVLQKVDWPLRVEGHTDNLPINTQQFPSNWELSTARAVAVVKYFIAHGGIAAPRLSAVGYGEAKPRSANDSPANRARNRRVEIVVEMNKES